MQSINKEEISNVQLQENVQSGEIVGKHQYNGGQVDWYIVDRTIKSGRFAWAWFGGPGPEEKLTHHLNILQTYRVN